MRHLNPMRASRRTSVAPVLAAASAERPHVASEERATTFA